MSDLNAEVEKANDMLWTREEQQAETEWGQRAEKEQRAAEIERMIEAKVAQALRLLRASPTTLR